MRKLTIMGHAIFFMNENEAYSTTRVKPADSWPN
ncbi:Uncharacterised protein [Serratia fonticola]|nr:Uncharacterised protein [Serratia fonticola]